MTNTTQTETRTETRTMSEVARAAKAIRADLKAAFPGTAFRVTSKSYSMGNSVRIAWDFGPCAETVNKLVDKYQDGDFDGMVDLYTHRSNPDNLPRAKYVHTDRGHGDEQVFGRMCRDVCALYGVEFEGSSTRVGGQWVTDIAYRAMSTTDMGASYSRMEMVDGRAVAR